MPALQCRNVYDLVIHDSHKSLRQHKACRSASCTPALKWYAFLDIIKTRLNILKRIYKLVSVKHFWKGQLNCHYIIIFKLINNPIIIIYQGEFISTEIARRIVILCGGFTINLLHLQNCACYSQTRSQEMQMSKRGGFGDGGGRAEEGGKLKIIIMTFDIQNLL